MKYILTLIFSLLLCAGLAQQKKQVLPTQAQIEWANAEIGVMYSLDMQVFEPSYQFRSNWNYHPDVSVFNPKNLNTDQWLRAAKAAGAKYAVLVAKHCSGFSLWPTKAHGYSVKNTRWGNGKGDIVRDFIRSCKKYGIKPGIYASTSVNAYMKVDNPGKAVSGSGVEQENYQKVLKTQLTELWSGYGKLFEIWFDGGVLREDQGGVAVLPLIKKLQPNAIAFQGPYGYENNVRWVGNENGVAPYPCWSKADSTTSATGTVEIKGLNGDPEGQFWCPGESDFPLRENASFEGGWFWKAGEDGKVRTLNDLRDRYNETVGRNTNMLLGIVLDNRGLVPDADRQRLAEFGQDLQKRFNKPLGATSGPGSTLVINFNATRRINDIIIQEDISKGEHVREYQLFGKKDGKWELLRQGSSVGHKRIEVINQPGYQAVKLEIVKADGVPAIKNFQCF